MTSTKLKGQLGVRSGRKHIFYQHHIVIIIIKISCQYNNQICRYLLLNDLILYIKYNYDVLFLTMVVLMSYAFNIAL